MLKQLAEAVTVKVEAILAAVVVAVVMPQLLALQSNLTNNQRLQFITNNSKLTDQLHLMAAHPAVFHPSTDQAAVVAARALLEAPAHQDPLDKTEIQVRTVTEAKTDSQALTRKPVNNHLPTTSASTAHPDLPDQPAESDQKDLQARQDNQELHPTQATAIRRKDLQDHQDHPDNQETQEDQVNAAPMDKSLTFQEDKDRRDHQDHPEILASLDSLVHQDHRNQDRQDLPAIKALQDHQAIQDFQEAEATMADQVEAVAATTAPRQERRQAIEMCQFHRIDSLFKCVPILRNLIVFFPLLVVPPSLSTLNVQKAFSV